MANGLFNLKQVMQGIQQGGWNGQKPPTVEYLVVAGGGGGGSGNTGNGGGGGGAGGLLSGIDPVPNGQTILVTVGAAGSGTTAGGTGTTNGGNSVFGSIVATGGGYGGNGYTGNTTPASGGSGGGAGASTSPPLRGANGIPGQGNNGGAGSNTLGYNGGGGGGAGTIGLDYRSGKAGNGGFGVASAISGTVTAYAGGGGGGAYNTAQGGTGGTGGGGTGGNNTTGTAGTANTGGGGGGAGGTASSSNGGSGIVIVSYPDVYAAPTATTGSPTVSTSGSGSVAFTGSTSVYLSTATNTSSFAFATGDFTVEFWIYTNSSGTYTVYDSRASGTNDLSPTLYLNSNAIVFYTNGSDRINGGTLTNATWNHIALVRIGTVTKLYLNGTQTGSSYTDTNNYINTSGRPFIGGGSIVAGQNPLNGYMTNVRVVKGVGVYTGTFTPSTTPLAATQSAGTNIAAITGTSTSLLLNSVSGGYLADSSTLANTFSVSTTPAWNSASPFTVTGYKNRVYTWTSSGSITF